MKNGQPILSVFDGYEKTVVIPVYQRKYAWTQSQCERLFDDIEELVHSKNPTHFFGAVVGKAEGTFSWQVIDGQQRLTTISVLMLALVHAIKAGEIECDSPKLANRILKNYLLSDPDDPSELRLQPVEDDKEAYSRLFQSNADLIESKNVTANYRYFRQRLEATSLSAEEIFEQGIAQLQIMFLDLEPHDNAQRIFESLNSTGISLTEGDKIRNFILMDLPYKEQKRIYNNYWVPMENRVDNHTDWFIRLYLTSKNGRMPRFDDVYDEFKKFTAQSDKSLPQILADVLAFATYSDELSHCTTPYDNLNRLLKRANTVIGDVALPLLWPAYGDCKEGIITPDDFTELVSIVERYTWRRFVSSVATNSLNKIFATSYNEIRKQYTPGETYSNIFSSMLLRRADTSGRFPDDEEFLSGMMTKNFFNIGAENRAYIFDALENGLSNDTRDIAGGLASQDLSIEHIMPQTLSAAWKKSLGLDSEELHSKWKNRIGNLTVTAYNSSYSNSAFQTKLTMENGFRDTAYRLNNYVCQQDEWGFEQIEERTRQLAQRAMELWPMITSTYRPPARQSAMIPLGEDYDFTNMKITGFQLGDATWTVKTWKDTLLNIVRFLLEDYREELIRLARDESQLITVGEESEMTNPAWFRQVDPALWVRVGSGTREKVLLLRNIFDYLALDKDELVFEFSEQSLDHGSNEVDEAPQASPYEPLIAFIPRFDAGDDVIAEFLDVFKQYAVNDPMNTLAGKNVRDFLKEKQDPTAKEILAVISIYANQASMIGKESLQLIVENGHLGSLLRALQVAE